MMVPFHAHRALTQPWASFATKVGTGFTTGELERLQALSVPMGWKTRVAVAEQSARSLLRVYLGKNAAERVIDGAPQPGELSPRRARCSLRSAVSPTCREIPISNLHRVGSRNLRGVRREQELFTLPELAPASV